MLRQAKASKHGTWWHHLLKTVKQAPSMQGRHDPCVGIRAVPICPERDVSDYVLDHLHVIVVKLLVAWQQKRQKSSSASFYSKPVIETTFDRNKKGDCFVMTAHLNARHWEYNVQAPGSSWNEGKRHLRSCIRTQQVANTSVTIVAVTSLLARQTYDYKPGSDKGRQMRRSSSCRTSGVLTTDESRSRPPNTPVTNAEHHTNHWVQTHGYRRFSTNDAEHDQPQRIKRMNNPFKRSI